MTSRKRAAVLAAVLFFGQAATSSVWADNAMGYRLLSTQEAQRLPRNGGALGLGLERAQRVTDAGMTFDIMRVNRVTKGSPGSIAGFAPGDMIVAVDGLVFPTIATFAAYVGSQRPGAQINVDYIPAGSGPQQAERVSVAVAGANATTRPQDPAPAAKTGMSTGAKVAIGLGALLGCYELGCFSRKSGNATVNGGQPAQ